MIRNVYLLNTFQPDAVSKFGFSRNLFANQYFFLFLTEIIIPYNAKYVN
jgi:hypothetical protein